MRTASCREPLAHAPWAMRQAALDSEAEVPGGRGKAKSATVLLRLRCQTTAAGSEERGKEVARNRPQELFDVAMGAQAVAGAGVVRTLPPLGRKLEAADNCGGGEGTRTREISHSQGWPAARNGPTAVPTTPHQIGGQESGPSVAIMEARDGEGRRRVAPHRRQCHAHACATNVLGRVPCQQRLRGRAFETHGQTLCAQQHVSPC